MFTDTYLYAFDGMNRVVSYRKIDIDRFNVRTIKYVISQMLNWGYGIKSIYMVGDRAKLGKEFIEAEKSTDFTEWFAFKDICEREGVCVFCEN